MAKLTPLSLRLRMMSAEAKHGAKESPMPMSENTVLRKTVQILLAALLLFTTACNPRQPQQMELWYWHHTYLATDAEVTKSKALIDRAAKARYTGMALWDSSWTFLSMPNWPDANVRRLKAIVDYATARGLRVMPVVAAYGHSNDVLKQHPDYAEGQRVIGSTFRVDDTGRQLTQLPSLDEHPDFSPRPLLVIDINVTPWRQYHVHLNLQTQSFKGIAQLEINDGRASRLDANLHPPPTQQPLALDYTFNSAASHKVRIQAGAFGPHEGSLTVTQFAVQETALVYVIRRSGTPLRLYDAQREYTEGPDFNPIHDRKLLTTPEFSNDNFHDPGPITLPATTRLRAGQTVQLDYYAVVPVYDEAVSVCLTDPAIERWIVDNTRASAALAPPGSPLLLSHDEIRQMNSCAECRARQLTAGMLLAQHIASLTAKLAPLGPLYIWSDMFDPHHNAIANLYQVEGTIAGSWKGLPREVTIMNWNLDHLHNSLLWFSGDDPAQPTPHRQIIAGFYDPADHDAAAAVRKEWQAARSIPGIAGTMYTTWVDDYSQLESFAQAAKEEWVKYRATSPLTRFNFR